VPSDFDERCREIARRFLVSAVIVDDEPSYPKTEQAKKGREPGRADQPVDDENELGSRSRQSLDAGAITGSFSKAGLICGVVKPARDRDIDAAAVKRADLVVIDWQLHNDDGKRALNLINSILEGDQGQRLRLIAVYTGKSEIEKIGREIVQFLAQNGYDFENDDTDNPVTLSCGHSHIGIYAKLGTLLNPELESRMVSEADLPDRLIGDFAHMTAGLLPNIALVALTAVRDSAHRVLDKFDGKLDAAFLTHRACLDVPDDSEQHMVAQIGSELRAIMEEEVGRNQPAGWEAIKSWIEEFKGNGNIDFGGGKKVSQQVVLDMLEKGVDATNVPGKSRAYSWLTTGFAHSGDGSAEDLELAWMTCFRAIDLPDKKLWLGAAVRKCGDSDCEEFLLCMRPRCDSVRMKGTESFLFLPLIKPNPKRRMFQLVVRSSSSDPKFFRVSVDTDMSRWAMIKFAPDKDAKAVIAEQNGSAGYVFKDVGGNRYEWIGELKTEVAHHVGQTLSSTLSGIALDRSEWLRRSERSG